MRFVCFATRYARALSAQRGLSHAAAPFFLHLQFAGLEPGLEGKKISKQTVELDGLIDHREMT